MYKIKNTNVKKEEGITLVALVITIVILIILATVTINMAFGDNGLVKYAEEARDKTANSTIAEAEGINSMVDQFANVLSEGGTTTDPEEPGETEKSEVEQAKEDGTKYTDTTPIKDDLDNTIYIPGGFHIAEDSATKVEGGIVIEDDSGNQFVWIPVGKYKTTVEEKTNNLSRRKFTSSEATEVNGDDVIKSDYYGEGDSRSIASDTIEAFKTSATSKGGFYIGRYEQGKGNVCKKDVTPYGLITRDDANIQAKAMYDRNSYVTSELISSYAWDTALNFICQINSVGYKLATTTNSAYGNIRTNSLTNTGMYTADKYCNIYDMLGNCSEWTTECGNGSFPCVNRGGSCYTGYYAANRSTGGIDIVDPSQSFRIQLYVK